MNEVSILLIGAGGHARACIDVIEQEGRYKVEGLLGTRDEVGTSVLGYPVLGTDDDLPLFATRIGCALVAVGQIKSPDVRIELFTRLVRTGCALPSIVSPLGYVSRHSVIGDGSIVMHGAIVNAGARVGRNCIVNNRALIEHDTLVADHCHVATAATLNGGVRVGVGSFVGSGAIVRQGTTIGGRCVVGMGHHVRTDCSDGVQLPRRSAG